MAASAYGEGIFITTNSNGSVLDLAAVGNSLYLNATRPVAGFSVGAPIAQPVRAQQLFHHPDAGQQRIAAPADRFRVRRQHVRRREFQRRRPIPRPADRQHQLHLEFLHGGDHRPSSDTASPPSAARPATRTRAIRAASSFVAADFHRQLLAAPGAPITLIPVQSPSLPRAFIHLPRSRFTNLTRAEGRALIAGVYGGYSDARQRSEDATQEVACSPQRL